MKKKHLLFLTLITIVMLLHMNSINAKAASGSLKGNKIIRPGDEITLELYITDSGKYGMEGLLEYDSNMIEFVSAETGVDGWKAKTSGNYIMVYDDDIINPINKTTLVVTLRFKLTSGSVEGTDIAITINDIVIADADHNSTNIAALTYTNTVARPLSGDATLSSLVISNTTITPNFAGNVTSYDAGEVDFTISKLDVKATATDANAKVSVKGADLTVGANKVVVTVTAENGSKKEYVINVTRKQDPNYVASNDASISNLTVNGGVISPTFNKDVTDYVIYLPYEKKGTTLTFSAIPNDSKAQKIEDVVTNPLTEGKNEIIITCKAEDGSTKDYKVIVYVMPEYSGELPDISNGEEGNEVPTTQQDKETESDNKETEENTTKAPNTTTTAGNILNENNNSNNSLNIIVVIIAVVEAVAIAVLVYLNLKSKKNIDTK